MRLGQCPSIWTFFWKPSLICIYYLLGYCPWTRMPTGCYQYFQDSQNWTGAQQLCRRRGGRLAELEGLKNPPSNRKFTRICFSRNWRHVWTWKCLNFDRKCNKVCVFDLVHDFSDNLQLHFYNQSEINSEDNTKWGHLTRSKTQTYSEGFTPENWLFTEILENN